MGGGAGGDTHAEMDRDKETNRGDRGREAFTRVKSCTHFNGTCHTAVILLSFYRHTRAHAHAHTYTRLYFSTPKVHDRSTGLSVSTSVSVFTCVLVMPRVVIYAWAAGKGDSMKDNCN